MKPTFESWQINRLEWQYLWHKLSLRWPEMWWQFHKKSIKPSTFFTLATIFIKDLYKKENIRGIGMVGGKRVMDLVVIFFLPRVALFLFFLFFLKSTGKRPFYSFLHQDLCKDWLSFTCNLFQFLTCAQHWHVSILLTLKCSLPVHFLFSCQAQRELCNSIKGSAGIRVEWM